MRVQDNHAHGNSGYKAIGLRDFFFLFLNALETRYKNYNSLTVHLPYEIQHPLIYKNSRKGYLFVKWGELIKQLLKINLYWENAPLEVLGKWNLKWGQMDWKCVPKNIDLCLDVGHLILESKNLTEARKRVLGILKSRNSQIKHLHIHVNNLKDDQHLVSRGKILEVLPDGLFNQLIEGRSYIFETGE